jgi:FkbM family methyltransferase
MRNFNSASFYDPRLKTQLEVIAPSALQISAILRNCLYHNEEIPMFQKWLKPGFIIDVGGNIGQSEFNLIHLGRPFVIFEPDKDNRYYLEANFKNLDIKYHLFDCALGKESSTATLALPSNEQKQPQEASNSGWLSLFGKGEGMVVEVKTLDSFQLGPVGFINLDVEGGEIDVLLGAEETIQKYKPPIYVELSDANQKMAGRYVRDLRLHLLNIGFAPVASIMANELYIHRSEIK